MSKHYIPFFTFVFLVLFSGPFSFNFIQLVIPGWHTTIIPPDLLWRVTILLFLIISSACYWKLAKRSIEPNWTLFGLHLILSIPVLICLKFLTYRGEFAFWGYDIPRQMIRHMHYMQVSLILYTVGQVCFFIYFFKSSRKGSS
jgi:hypothetical protein